MKKQLLIAAVAATMTSAAIADISISGDAKFEYQNVDTGTTTTNKTNTEVNLKLRGKSGDTSVVMDIAANGGAGAGALGQGGTVVEDMYLTTKVGDVSVKAGNYASGTSGILGEIDNGSRSNNKVTLTTTLGGATVYVGNGGSSAASTGFTAINNNMFAGVIMDVAGVTVQAKKVSETVDAFGVSGDVAGFGVRLEQLKSDTAASDVTFGNITKEVNGITLGYAWIDADDSATSVTEDDSSIFAVEMASSSTQKTNVNGVQQFSAQTTVAGNTVTVKAGTLTAKTGYQDADFTQVDVKRALASGATLALTYTNADSSNIATGSSLTDTATFEADISVKF